MSRFTRTRNVVIVTALTAVACSAPAVNAQNAPTGAQVQVQAAVDAAFAKYRNLKEDKVFTMAQVIQEQGPDAAGWVR